MMNFREIVLIMSAVAITILNTCEPMAAGQYGFDLPVGPGSEGKNTVTVDFTVSAIHLTGIMRVSKGTLSAELMSPSGAVVFSAAVEAPGEFKIDRYYPAGCGAWKMRYYSTSGTGYLRMQLNLIR